MANRPKTIEISMQQQLLSEEPASYWISGLLDSTNIDTSKWQRPPHVVLANLPNWGATAKETGDPTLIELSAAQAFVRQCGPLHFQLGDYHPRLRKGESPEKGRFVVVSEQLHEARAVLRKAWEGDGDALQRVTAGALEVLKVVDADASGSAPVAFEWLATDLWNLICILFLQDYVPGRLGKCANPECQLYFIKPRRTQTVCERPECLSWAQKKSSLNWWNRQGRVNRARKEKRRSNSDQRSHRE